MNQVKIAVVLLCVAMGTDAVLADAVEDAVAAKMRLLQQANDEKDAERVAVKFIKAMFSGDANTCETMITADSKPTWDKVGDNAVNGAKNSNATLSSIKTRALSLNDEVIRMNVYDSSEANDVGGWVSLKKVQGVWKVDFTRFIEDAIATARQQEEEKKVQQQIESSKKELKSFCGITFGCQLNGGEEKDEYLEGTVKLPRPFRGVKTATVFASVKTKKIFLIRLNGVDRQARKVILEKFSPIEFERISKMGWLEQEGALNSALSHLQLKNSYISVEEEAAKRKHIDTGRVIAHQEADGNVVYEKEESVIVDVPGLRVSAVNEEYAKIAVKEYKEASGGDGSSVL